MRRRAPLPLLVVAGGLALCATAAALPERALFVAEQAVGTAAGLLVAWGAWLRRRGTPQVAARGRDAALAALALAAAAAWLGLTGFSLGGLLHEWDAAHHYLGAKYFRELGYDGLYECVLVAEAEDGAGADLASSPLRDLRTNEIVPGGEVLADPGRCTRRFSAARWQAFRHDVGWFRQRFDARRWAAWRTDHGFNAPPTWNVLGTALTNLAPASAAQIVSLVSLDPLLLVVALGFVASAFGWRTCCVAWIFLATCFPTGWDWVGGSILRYDWLAAAAIGVSLLRLGRPAGGGALLACSAALRLFPLLLLGGVALGMLRRMVAARDARPTRDERRLWAGAVAAAALLVAAATAVAGPRAWPAFAADIRLHAATPLDNHVGLPALLAYDHGRREARTLDPSLRDPYVPWREARRETAAARRPLRWLLSLGFLALMVAAVRGRPSWVAAVVGAGSAAVFVEVTCYYQSILVALAFLRAEREEVAAGLLLLGGLSWIPLELGLYTDEIMRAFSVGSLALVVAATALVARGAAGATIRSQAP